MSEQEYNSKVNKNTIDCWLIIALVLVIAYLIEIIKGIREIPYVIVFTIITLAPWVITLLVNKCQKGFNLNIRYFLGIGYMIFYTFVLITSNNPLTFVYILPMTPLLIVYLDKKLIFGTYFYALLINLILIYVRVFKWNEKSITLENSSLATMYEIQMACIILCGIFLFKTIKLLQFKEKMITNLRNDTIKDGLTNVYNYRFLDENINTLFNPELNENISVCFIDIDNFKQFNDNYGHKFGDKVLITLSTILSKYCDNFSDKYVIRVGGDEFVIIALNCDDEKFVETIKAASKNISETKLNYLDEEVSINISAGISSKKYSNNFLKIYKKADANLLKAKTSGKNIVIY